MANINSGDFEDYSASEDMKSELNDASNSLKKASKMSDDINSLRDRLRNDNVESNAGETGTEKATDKVADNNSHSPTSLNKNKSENSIPLNTKGGPGVTKEGAGGTAGKEKNQNNISSNAEGNASKAEGKNAAFTGVKDGAEKASSLAAKKGGEKVAANAAKATAGAATATGGIGTIIAEAIEKMGDAIKIGKKATDYTASESGMGRDLKGFYPIVIGLVAVLTIPTLFAANTRKTVSGPLAQYRADQAYNAAQTEQEINSETGESYDNYEGMQDTNKPKSFYVNALKSVGSKFINLFKHLLGGSAEGEEEDPYDVANAFYEATTKTVDIIKESILKKARTHGVYGGQIEKDVKAIIDKQGYDAELTWESFDTDQDIFENLNYAEFISVMSENEIYNSENVTRDDMVKVFDEVDKVRLLYRLHVEPAEMTAEEAGRVTPVYGENGEITNRAELDELILYGKVTLRSYYLKDLYEIFGLSAEANNYEFDFDGNQYIEASGKSNIDMLDRIESTLRSYCDVSEDADIESLVGPNTRTEYDGEPIDSELDGEVTEKEEEFIYGDIEVNVAHGEIGAEIGDITQVAMSVARAFVNNNLDSPYSINQTATFSFSWGTYTVYPCCASGTTLVAKYFGLKGNVTSYTGTVANDSYSGSMCNISNLSELRVGDILTYGTTHTEIVTKIDGNKVYIAGFGSNTNIWKDADLGYNKVKDKSSALSSLKFNSSGTPQVWRPNESTFNFDAE